MPGAHQYGEEYRQMNLLLNQGNSLRASSMVVLCSVLLSGSLVHAEPALEAAMGGGTVALLGIDAGRNRYGQPGTGPRSTEAQRQAALSAAQRFHCCPATREQAQHEAADETGDVGLVALKTKGGGAAAVVLPAEYGLTGHATAQYVREHIADHRARHGSLAANLTWGWNRQYVAAWAVKSVRGALDRRGTNLDKVLEIWRVTYEKSNSLSWSHGPFGGDFVCRHRAILFYLAAEQEGFTVQFRCNGYTSSDHCWNRVKVSGKWYVVDCMWGIWYLDPNQTTAGN
jgi:hypothetical protein